jgi:hypothetical protein
VDQAAEQVLSTNISRAHRQRGLVFGYRWRKGESAMGPAAVVVLGVSAEHCIEIPPTEDERPIGALRPDRLDDPFGLGVGVRGPDRSKHHLGPWGSRTQIRSRGASVVFVDQTADEVLAANVSWAHNHRDLVSGGRCLKAESLRPQQTLPWCLRSSGDRGGVDPGLKAPCLPPVAVTVTVRRTDRKARGGVVATQPLRDRMEIVLGRDWVASGGGSDRAPTGPRPV